MLCTMNDTQLIRHLMKVTGWGKAQTAKEIGFGAANITRILQGKQQLSPLSRKMVSMLLTQHASGNIGDCETCVQYEPQIRHCALLDIWFDTDGAEQEGACEQYLPDPSSN